VNQPSPEEFFQACGARGPLVLEIERQGHSEAVRHTLSLPFALIGRDERADLRLEDKRVSNRHAYLQVVAGRLWYVDLGSRAGTHGQSDQPAALLCPGQHLSIDPFVVRLAEGELSADGTADLVNPLTSDSYDPSALPRVGLDFLEGTAKQPLWMLDRVLTLVGGSALCKVRLHSPTVSRTHCALLHTTNGLWVVDLLSREGIHVNGTAVRWARLQDSDELRIGQFLVCVRVLGRPKGATLPVPFAPEFGRTTNVLLSPAQSLIPSAVTAALPADLEGLLSALQVAATPSAVAPVTGGAAETLLLPMIRQFALMQQQMFDQFQQALMMMVQTFSGLHRDQLQLIRQELNQLSELTRELQSLQAEQARLTPLPARTEIGSASQSKVVSPQQPAGRDVSTTAERTAPPAPPRPGKSTEETPAPAAADSRRSTPEVHAWLAQRLATLQQERQGRWQRILHVLTGK
jgi:hypothetical protein